MSVEVEVKSRMELATKRSKDELLGYLYAILYEVNYNSPNDNLNFDHVECFLSNCSLEFHSITELGIKIVDMIRDSLGPGEWFEGCRVLDHAVGVKCGCDCPHRNSMGDIPQAERGSNGKA